MHAPVKPNWSKYNFTIRDDRFVGGCADGRKISLRRDPTLIKNLNGLAGKSPEELAAEFRVTPKRIARIIEQVTAKIRRADAAS
jgi:hypothetical protein